MGARPLLLNATAITGKNTFDRVLQIFVLLPSFSLRLVTFLETSDFLSTTDSYFDRFAQGGVGDFPHCGFGSRQSLTGQGPNTPRRLQFCSQFCSHETGLLQQHNFSDFCGVGSQTRSGPDGVGSRYSLTGLFSLLNTTQKDWDCKQITFLTAHLEFSWIKQFATEQVSATHLTFASTAWLDTAQDSYFWRHTHPQILVNGGGSPKAIFTGHLHALSHLILDLWYLSVPTDFPAKRPHLRVLALCDGVRPRFLNTGSGTTDRSQQGFQNFHIDFTQLTDQFNSFDRQNTGADNIFSFLDCIQDFCSGTRIFQVSQRWVHPRLNCCETIEIDIQQHRACGNLRTLVSRRDLQIFDSSHFAEGQIEQTPQHRFQFLIYFIAVHWLGEHSVAFFLPLLAFLALGYCWHWLLTSAPSWRSTQTQGIIVTFFNLDSCLEAPNGICHPFTSGKPGPKSRSRPTVLDCSPKRSFHLRSAFLLLFVLTMGSTRGEGCVPFMGNAEASDAWQTRFIDIADAKRHESRPTTGNHAINWHPQHTKVVKRSIRRAYSRACIHGLAWYKGQCYTPQDFPPNLKSTTTALSQTHQRKQNPQLHECNRRHRDSRRMSLLNWNTGGLTTAKLDEIKIWLEDQHIDAAILTETRMTFESEWSDAAWHHLHTGNGADRGGGILCLISTKICTAQQIRWRPVIDGRLVHVQMQLPNRNIDVVGCYQHTQNPSMDRWKARSTWWTRLDHLLHGLATRNTLFLAGDFNTSLPQSCSHAGPQHFWWNGNLVLGAQHRDQGQFMELLRMHGLVALNTWHPGLGPTFKTDLACSRIDFLITRKNLADGQAKQIRYTWDAPFCSDHGHAPMIGHLRKSWLAHAIDPRAQTISAAQRQQALIDFHADTTHWHDFIQHTGETMLHRMTQVKPSDDHLIPDMHSIVCSNFHQFFPSLKRQKQTDSVAKDVILTKWQHRKAMLQPRQITQGSVLTAWWHAARFQTLKRQAQNHAKQVRLIKFTEITESATAAASRHDSHALFRIINRFTPKQPRRRMQLRNTHGHIANPTEATAMLRQFIQDTWKGPHQFPFPSTALTGLPFTMEELEQALRAIPAGKAVARPCAPGFAWKSLAPIITPTLYSILQDWWLGTKCFIPSWFKDSWMILIPKPNKPPVNPRALRPLALQEPVGKAIVGILASKAQWFMLPALTAWPIWSYLPMRSTQDALLRVALHCKHVRSLVAGHRSTPFSRAQGIKHHKGVGGICIFLDIERAFDMVSRPQLFAKLEAVGIPASIAKLLTMWHQNTGYYLFSQGVEEHIPVGRGLRQGCKAAPLMWNIYLLLFLTELNSRVDSTWLQTSVNFYADDGQLGGSFCTSHELSQLLDNIHTTLTLLQEFGMNINSAKCVALLEIKGSASRALRSKLTEHRDGKDWLILRRETQTDFLIPIAHTAKYLGTVMTYGQLEDTTLHHRAQISKAAFGRLGRWLKGKRGLPLKHRLRLWSTCVYPILSYGICSVGLTAKGIQFFQQHVYGMIRQLLQLEET